MTTILGKFLSLEDRDQVWQTVLNASEPIAPFWPMWTMILQNPIHGLEYLPFDQVVRKGIFNNLLDQRKRIQPLSQASSK